jgi:hypothetical protein
MEDLDTAADRLAHSYDVDAHGVVHRLSGRGGSGRGH